MTKLLQKAIDEAAKLPDRDQDALASLLLNALEAQKRQGESWREENREAIEAYNEHVTQHGVFSAGLRTF